jgi:hypothetical protein
VFDRLLSDPLNRKMCNWGLAIVGILFFGNLIVHYYFPELPIYK